MKKNLFILFLGLIILSLTHGVAGEKHFVGEKHAVEEHPYLEELHETAPQEKVLLTEEHEEKNPPFLTVEISPYARIPLWIILTPLIGAGLLLLFGKNEIRRNSIAFLTTFLTFGLLLTLFKPVVQGIVINGHQYKGIFYSFYSSGLPAGPGSLLKSLSYFPFFNLTFKVDPAGLLIALISGLIWLLGTIYSFSSLTQVTASHRLGGVS